MDENVQTSEVIEQTKREELEKKISEYNQQLKRVETHLHRIIGNLTLGEDVNYSDVIRKLDDEVKELSKNANVLIGDIDEFKSKYQNVDLSTNYKQIMGELQNIKDGLRTLKRNQVTQYNNKVEAARAIVGVLKNVNDTEIQEMLSQLPELNKCDVEVTHIRWTDINYLNNIDYNKLVEFNKRLLEIKNKINDRELESAPVTASTDLSVVQPTENGLVTVVNNSIDWTMLMWEFNEEVKLVETEIESIESQIKEDMSLEDINRLRALINFYSESLNAFRARLENNKDKIEEDDYNRLLERYVAAVEDFIDLNSKLNEVAMTNASVTDNKVYSELMKRVNYLKGSIENLKLLAESLHGKINFDTVEAYLDSLNNNYVKDLEKLKKDIEDKFKSGELNIEQYNNLKKEVENLKTTVEKLNESLKDPGVIKDADIFALLNGDIGGLEVAVDNLEKQIDSLEKPIKDREIRKQIDAIIKVLEKEVKRLEKTLEIYKEEDPEKYQATVERLNSVKQRMDKVGKNYRKKCPLMVRAVKSAKAFFKKHKKVMLVAAGLAALALIGYHVLIPALMHGNIMISATAPALRGFVTFINNVLGSIIGATQNAHGACFLANGIMINPSVASTSLLKGLAISGISSASLIAPVVLAIKKLIEKMNMSELKQKLSEGYKIGKSKVKTTVDNTKGKIKTVRDKKLNKKLQLGSQEALRKLVADYRKSGKKSVEEYCEDKELTEKEIMVLKAYDMTLLEERNKLMEKQKKKMEQSANRKGRK